MMFSPRSLLAWIAVAIGGADPLGHRGATSMSLTGTADPGPDDRPAGHATRRG
jgi:hypothetical protein